MDWKLFTFILAAGIVFVIVQGVCSWLDGYLSETQMRSRGITNGYSFLQHGGMWADVLIISPIVAYSASKYQFSYFSIWGLGVLAGAVAITLGALRMYSKMGIATPEAHTHHGKTTAAGWIHALFAVVVIWVLGMISFGQASPSVSGIDVVFISLLLTPFFYLGVKKFSKRWTFSSQAKWQVAGGVALVWAVAVIRLWL